MANAAAVYRLIYVRFDHSVFERKSRGAPAPTKLASRGMESGKSPAFGIRYYPSRRKWRVFDFRQMQTVWSYKGGPWLKQAPYVAEVADEDAAVMFARMNL